MSHMQIFGHELELLSDDQLAEAERFVIARKVEVAQAFDADLDEIRLEKERRANPQ